MREVDDTPVGESESEETYRLAREALTRRLEAKIQAIEKRVANLEAEVADLHHRRRVSRQQAVDQDPEWYS